MSRYVFVDGRYFEQVCRRWEEICEFDLFSNIDFNRLRDKSERLFYFDALPNKKNNQSDEKYQSELLEKVKHFNRIRASDHCHVRDGVTRMREGRPVREQKGVDVLLAVEVLQHAYRGTVSEAEILTGDLDFYPVFEALQQTSVRGRLLYDSPSTTDELRFSADFALPITFDWLLQKTDVFFSNKHYLRDGVSLQHQKSFWKFEDSVSGSEIRISKIENGYLSFDGRRHTFASSLEVLKGLVVSTYPDFTDTDVAGIFQRLDDLSR